MKKWMQIGLLYFFLFACCACVKNTKEGTIENITYKETEEITDYVKIFVKNKGTILVALDKTAAPRTVSNFQELVQKKFYDGIIFHRVIKNFVIQAGDPTGTGTGGSEHTIVGEFKENGISNTLSHVRGVISMARGNDNNSASSQFFICHQDALSLDGNYAAFGKVIAGMDVVDKIANVKTDENDKPTTNVFIESIRFVTITEN